MTYCCYRLSPSRLKGVHTSHVLLPRQDQPCRTWPRLWSRCTRCCLPVRNPSASEGRRPDEEKTHLMTKHLVFESHQTGPLGWSEDSHTASASLRRTYAAKHAHSSSKRGVEMCAVVRLLFARTAVSARVPLTLTPPRRHPSSLPPPAEVSSAVQGVRLHLWQEKVREPDNYRMGELLVFTTSICL